MVSKDTEISRGKNAERILNDKLFKESFTYLRELYLNEWENSPARDKEARESLWVAIKMLGTVEGHLQTVMQTGKLANRQIEDLAKAASVNRGVAK
tara:strand:- start:27 stop:314 length:288 start_codon:yes stop_codon:yes gene_type:complete